MPMTEQEKRVSEVLKKLEGLFDGEDSIDVIKTKVKALDDYVEELKTFDIKVIAEQLESMKSKQDKMIQQIKSNRNQTGFVPGFEDLDGTKFSMVRAMTAAAHKDWELAPYEHEIIKAAQEAREKDPHYQKTAQAVGDDTLGGFFVPDAVIPDVIQAIYTRSVMVSLGGDGTTRVSVLDGLTGSPIKIPKFNGGTIAYWIGEEDEIAESNVTVGDMTMAPKQLGCLVRLTSAMQRFGSYGFESLLRNDMVRAIAKKVDYAVMYGRGSNHEPMGIARDQGIKIYRAENGLVYRRDLASADGTFEGEAELQAIAEWAGGELTFDHLDNMQGALDDDDLDVESSYATIAPGRYFRRLKQRKVDYYTGQTSNQGYLVGTPILPSSALTELIGPWDRSNQIPKKNKGGATIGGTSTSAAKFGDVFSGNFNEVLFGRWSGLEVSDDGGKGKNFASGHTNMKMIMLCDVGIRQPRALILCPDARMFD